MPGSIDDILRRLKRVKKEGRQYKACCPAHGDEHASLSITQEGDRILVKCHTGCSFESIAGAIGLKPSDFFLSDRRTDLDRKPQFTYYDYLDGDGILKYQSVRMEPGREGKKKTFFQRQPDGAGGWINNLSGIKGRWPYRLPKILASSSEEWIWIVEGEKDVQRLEDCGLLATTSAGGALKWPGNHVFSMYFRGRKVVIIADNDSPNKLGKRVGLEHALDVARKLQAYVASIKVLTERELVGLPGGGGDVSDWLNEGHTADELVEIAGAAPEWIDDRTDQTDSDSSGKPPKRHQLRDRWLDKGPPIVFARGDFWEYENGLWRPIGEYLIKQKIEEVVEAAAAEGIEPGGGLLNSIVEITKAKIARVDDVFDLHPDYLVCKNGTLHIPTKKLEPHLPELYATTGVGFDYDPGAKCEVWDGFIYWLGEKIGTEVVKFLQEFVGYCFTTETKYEMAVFIYGQPGSGKSTFVEGIKNTLADRYCSLGLRDIELSRFALSQLPGKTLAEATEQPGDYIRALDVINKIISGEPITYEQKFKPPITIRPTVKILWAMESLPKVLSAGSGLFRRVQPVPFGIPVPEDEKNASVKERIKQESAGILNWGLEGLARLTARGEFLIPDRIKQASQEFRESNDIVNAFITECCQVGRDRTVKSGDLYKTYQKWCGENGHKPMSSTRIVEDYRRLGFEKFIVHGYTHWKGVELKDEWKIDKTLFENK